MTIIGRNNVEWRARGQTRREREQEQTLVMAARATRAPETILFSAASQAVDTSDRRSVLRPPPPECLPLLSRPHPAACTTTSHTYSKWRLYRDIVPCHPSGREDVRRKTAPGEDERSGGGGVSRWGSLIVGSGRGDQCRGAGMRGLMEGPPRHTAATHATTTLGGRFCGHTVVSVGSGIWAALLWPFEVKLRRVLSLSETCLCGLWRRCWDAMWASPL